VSILGNSLGNERLYQIYSALGFFTQYQMNITTLAPIDPGEIENAARGALGLAGFAPDPEQVLLVSPLQMALAAATLSNDGVRPAPHLTLSINHPQTGWSVLPLLDTDRTVFPPTAARNARQDLTNASNEIWFSLSKVSGSMTQPELAYSWLIGGTSTAWQGSPLALAILVEEDNIPFVKEAGASYLLSTLHP
jgi:cell division protein FtsI/penicillin-binding protein 2